MNDAEIVFVAFLGDCDKDVIVACLSNCDKDNIVSHEGLLALSYLSLCTMFSIYQVIIRFSTCTSCEPHWKHFVPHKVVRVVYLKVAIRV